LKIERLAQRQVIAKPPQDRAKSSDHQTFSESDKLIKLFPKRLIDVTTQPNPIETKLPIKNDLSDRILLALHSWQIMRVNALPQPAQRDFLQSMQVALAAVVG
jgi:hypothetical protein